MFPESNRDSNSIYNLKQTISRTSKHSYLCYPAGLQKKYYDLVVRVCVGLRIRQRLDPSGRLECSDKFSLQFLEMLLLHYRH